jgi:hypothetical protein
MRTEDKDMNTQITKLIFGLVHEGDEFSYDYNQPPHLKHIPSHAGGRPLRAFVYIERPSGYSLGVWPYNDDLGKMRKERAFVADPESLLKTLHDKGYRLVSIRGNATS